MQFRFQSGDQQISFKQKKVPTSIISNSRSGQRYSIYIYWITKRFFDVLLSILILCLTLPIMVLIAVAIRIDSPGDVIFRHRRVGINRRTNSDPSRNGTECRKNDRSGRPFTLYKFRTMYADAQERFPELYKYNFTADQREKLPIKVMMGSEPGAKVNWEGNGLGSDPRLTRVGRWLRRTSLDELPNFINVIRGDMSLVGPRPDISDNVPNYKLEHMEKFNVKPGITGLAQIMGRGTLSFHRTNELDIEYINNQSPWLDAKILLKTVLVSIKGIGSY